MNQLVVLKFSDQARTDEAIRALRKMHSERSVKLFASTAVARDSQGKLSVQEITGCEAIEWRGRSRRAPPIREAAFAS